MHESTTRFHALHASGCFVIPNPWDAGSARLLAGMGFPALATTSSGFAWTLGRPDNRVTLDEALAHFRAISSAGRAARKAIDDSGTGIVLTARCETYLVGRPELAEAVRRLSAYAEAGADCLYAPGVRDLGEIRTLVDAVAPKAVNVLVSSGFTTVEELRAIGVRRISVGGALARAAWGGFLAAAREIAEQGTFNALGRAVPFADINGSFT